MEAWGSMQLNTERHWIHAVVSPPQDWAKSMITTKQGLDEMYDRAISLISSLGVQAGLIACHPWRRNKNDLFGDGTDAPSFVWRSGPHFHIVGWGYLDWKEISRSYTDNGWLIKEIKPESERLSLSGTIGYILSHVGLPTAVYKDGRPSRQMKSFRYFGDFANGSKHNENGMRRIDVIKLDRIKRCKTCGAPLEYLQDDCEFVTYVDRTQVFVRPKDYDDVKEYVREMEQDLLAADMSAGLIEYNKLEFYLKSDKIIMAPRMRGDNDSDGDKNVSSDNATKKNRIPRHSRSCDCQDPVHRMNRNFREF